MILVVGATGQLGSAVVARLVREHRRVRALVRPGADRSHLVAPGVEFATGDLRDPASLAAACAGVEAVIATATVVFPRGRYSFLRDEIEGYRNLLTACEDQGVRQIVFTSIAAFPEPYRSRVPTLRCKALIDDLLEFSPVAHTVIRAAPFMDDYFALMGSTLPFAGATAATLRRPFWMSQLFLALTGGLIERRGIALAPRPTSRRHSFVALDDVCDACVKSLGHPAALNRSFDLGGPEALSWEDVADLYASVLGRRVRLFAPAPAWLLRAGAALLRPWSEAASNQLGILWALSSHSLRLDSDVALELGLKQTSAEAFLRQRAPR